MGVSKDKEYYESVQNSIDDMMIYHQGKYADRNNIIINHLNDLMKDGSVVLDLAAGSSYIAEAILDDNRISKYVWNDFNSHVVAFAKSRVQNNKFEIRQFDASDEVSTLEEFNVFICISLEHLAKDIEILSNLNNGCLISICSPNFDDPGHVRHFKSLAEFEDRYAQYIDIKRRSISISGSDEKYVLTGYKL